MRRPWIVACVGGLLACWVCSPLLGQGLPGGPRQPARVPEGEPVTVEGTIRAVAPGQIQVLTHTNQNWVVAVPPKCEVHARGTGTPALLAVGKFVQFRAEVDRQGTAHTPVAELTVFVPTRPDAVGIWPDDPGNAKPREGAAQPFGLGATPDGPKPNGAEAVAETMPCRVAGRITALAAGKMTVHVGRGLVRAELAEQPVVQVDLPDYSLARPGDKITARGQMPPGRLGLAQASSLTIELSQPVGTQPAAPRAGKPPAGPVQPQGKPTGELPQ